MALNSRCMEGANDNREVINRIVMLRKEYASLLGHKSYAQYQLGDRMARTPEAIEVFFDVLTKKVYPLARKEMEAIRAFKEKQTGDAMMYPWDISYYAEKMRKELFDFSSEDLRPYFALENVLEGIFEHLKRLFDLDVTVRNDIPVYHPEVKTYELREGDGTFRGVLYLDLFPRASKGQGGWIDDIRAPFVRDGIPVRAHELIVCNLTKPVGDDPALLSMRDVETLFHEFGHGLHSIFSESSHQSLAGRNVLYDFVEFPSQLLEQWASMPEALALFARHYKTGEPIPSELLQKLEASKKFGIASDILAQIEMSVLDMRWHDEDIAAVSDIEAFEKEILQPYELYPHVPGTALSTTFRHIFDGGYDVGYYVYKWSEVLAADAFEYFKENGLFSQEIASKFREHVLSKGNTEDPGVLYERFRGRAPDPDALLRSKGLL
jgi:peptidyl-dipeptidase Dcp